MKIESLQNQKVKEWKKLQEKKYRDKTNLFLIEGDHLLQEALRSQKVVEIISTSQEYQIPNLPFYEVTPAILKKMSNQKSSTNVIAICKKLEARKPNGNICILENIQDPGNLGTIIRSAVAFQIDTIFLSQDTVDLYNDKVLRASEGMIFHKNIQRVEIDETTKQLKKDGYTIYATDVLQGQNLKEIKFPTKSAIIIGNEGSGISKKTKELCDELIHIPMSPNCESLNAGVSASIIFYEMGGISHE